MNGFLRFDFHESVAETADWYNFTAVLVDEFDAYFGKPRICQWAVSILSLFKLTIMLLLFTSPYRLL